LIENDDPCFFLSHDRRAYVTGIFIGIALSSVFCLYCQIFSEVLFIVIFISTFLFTFIVIAESLPCV
jgi:hypothetical protein